MCNIAGRTGIDFNVDGDVDIGDGDDSGYNSQDDDCSDRACGAVQCLAQPKMGVLDYVSPVAQMYAVFMFMFEKKPLALSNVRLYL